MAELALVIDKQVVVTPNDATPSQMAEIAEWMASNPNATTEDVKDQLALLSINYTGDEEVAIIGGRPFKIRH